MYRGIHLVDFFFGASNLKKKCAKVKVRHQYQGHRWQICHSVNNTVGKFATRVNDTGGKFSHLYCWFIRVANLPPVSMIPASNLSPVAHNGDNIGLPAP
jgi:hypothetical protein